MLMGQLRRLSFEDAGSGNDPAVLDLATRHMLSSYDASYLDLAKMVDLPLATGDRKMATAVRNEVLWSLGHLRMTGNQPLSALGLMRNRYR